MTLDLEREFPFDMCFMGGVNNDRMKSNLSASVRRTWLLILGCRGSVLDIQIANRALHDVACR